MATQVKKHVSSIDMTPTWEEATGMIFALIERGDIDGQKSAMGEMRRMGRLADAASVALGSHRRPDAPVSPQGEAIAAIIASLKELLAYEDDRPLEGTKGAEIYARAEQAMARLEALQQTPETDKAN